MIRFECDYAEGAHERIINRLAEINGEQNIGYGEDAHCEAARAMIKGLCGECDVHFLVGGTQTNLTVISSILRPHQGVLCASSGHVNVHESGAIEAVGHKVLTIPSDDGKITAKAVENAVKAHYADVSREHIVQPGMVYISNPTENGTIYVKSELTELYRVCREFSLPLYIDGARLGYALESERSDMTLRDIAERCDVFYIGGTKVGMLFGEAVVITNDALKKDFRYIMKQKGGMLAKGWLLGVQYEEMFRDGLYFEVSRHADTLAGRLRDALTSSGYEFLYRPDSNQLFPILPDALIEKLSKKYAFYIWKPLDNGRSAIRVCTSWATKESDVDAFIADINGGV